MSKARPQLSLRALFATVTIIAVCTAVGRSKEISWHAALFMLVSTSIAVGLVRQAQDIRRALLQWHNDDVAKQLAWRIAWSWRLVFGAVIVLSCVSIILYSMDVINEPAVGDNRLLWGFYWYENLLKLLIVIALSAGITGMEVRRPSTVVERVVDACGICAALAFAFFVLFDISIIVALEHVFIRGRIAAYPTRWFNHVIFEPDVYSYVELSKWLRLGSFAALQLSLLGGYFLCLAGGRIWQRQSSQLVVWLACWSCVISALTFDLWMHFQGFAMLSPLLANAETEAPRRSAVFAWIVFGGVFAVAATWRLHCRRETPTGSLQLPWYDDQKGYISERRILFLGLIIAQIGAFAESDAISALEMLVNPIDIALMWLTLRGLVISRSPERIRRMGQLAPVSFVQLATTFCTVTLTLVALVESIRWSSFMFWITC